MKPSTTITLLLALGAAVYVFGQGNLTPTSAPAPSMKRLDQIEARTIINATNTPGDATHTFIISQPGSYYLTGNITGSANKHGISIQADDVTLDLNGFALLSGTGSNLRGITMPATPVRSNISVRNGSIRGWTGGGAWLGAAAASVEKLSLSGNTGATGLSVGNGSMVKDCQATANGIGFYCPDRTQISLCISTINTSHGFQCASFVNILDCTSSRNSGSGFHVSNGCSILRCSATRNIAPAESAEDGYGIRAATQNCIISECMASNNSKTGINAGFGCTVSNCTAGSNGVSGISAEDASVTNCTALLNTVEDLFVLDSLCASCRANTTETTGSTLHGNFFGPP